MRFSSTLCAGVLLALGLGACNMDGPYAPYGWIYSEVKGPGRYYRVEQGMGPGSKSGGAEAMGILGLIAMGDCSVEKAAQNGGIKKIHTIDYKYFNVLGILYKWNTQVTGE